MAAGQRKRGHPDQELEQERPPKRGNRGRGRPPGNRIVTGANSTPVIQPQGRELREESIRLGEEDGDAEEEDMVTIDSQEQQESEEDPLLQGLRLGEL